MHRGLCHCKKDFDAWAYHLVWPQSSTDLPLFGTVQLTVEDFKFAYNAWNLLRLSLFYGTGYPHVMSSLSSTTPSMAPSRSSNNIFYRNAKVNCSLDSLRTKIALTPSHTNAIAIQTVDWKSLFSRAHADGKLGIELVLGMENGLSPHIEDSCDHHVYIPQYGSVGSLSMLAALSIAVHLCACDLERKADQSGLLRSAGHMPLTKNHEVNPPPHEADLIHLSNDDIKAVLSLRRSSYHLQLSVAVFNEMADRNIGAIIRNANVFNCEKVIVINRRKFNRRGALGTHRISSVLFLEDLQSDDARRALEGYELWLLHQYYPYLHIHSPYGEHIVDHKPFLNADNVGLRAWLSSQLHFSQHPLPQNFKHLLGNAIYLDDEQLLQREVQRAYDERSKGILLVAAEEGATPHPSLASLASKVVFIRDPSRIPAFQRGLNGGLSTAIALERLRSAIDSIAARPA